MRKFILEKANKNIGALCGFLKNAKNKEYLDFILDSIPLGLENIKLSEKLYYFVNGIKDLQLCDCGEHRKFIRFKDGYRMTCGVKSCVEKSRKKTNIINLGVDNPLKSEKIKKKIKETNLKKWGVDSPMKNDFIKDKFKKTMLENWGVEWTQQSNEIKEKSLETFKENPNKEEVIKNRVLTMKSKTLEEKNRILEKRKNTIVENWGSMDNFYKNINNKIKEKSLENFGATHHLASKEIIDKRVLSYKKGIVDKIIISLPDHLKYLGKSNNENNTDTIIKLRCSSCNKEFKINRQYLDLRIKSNKNPCLICEPKLSGKSNLEIELYNFIADNYNGEIIKNGELDIYLPNLNLAFEFNGLYWHSEEYKDKSYHINKTNKCLDKGIKLIHIWEDDWIYKREIVESIILNNLNLSNKIWARKCEVLEVDNKLARSFLEKNHIQGFVGSKIKLGLFYKGELVSLMTFGGLRKSLGQKSNNLYDWELLRFCNKLNHSVVGGASKLFKYFTRNYNYNEIISYSDTSRGVGNMYKKLGFEFSHNTVPNFYWIVNDIRKHRFNFRKDKLIKEGYSKNKTALEIMYDRGFKRIFDCGSKKWVYKINI